MVRWLRLSWDPGSSSESSSVGNECSSVGTEELVCASVDGSSSAGIDRPAPDDEVPETMREAASNATERSNDANTSVTTLRHEA